jgi:hypothetical protein
LICNQSIDTNLNPNACHKTLMKCYKVSTSEKIDDLIVSWGIAAKSVAAKTERRKYAPQRSTVGHHKKIPADERQGLQLKTYYKKYVVLFLVWAFAI